MENVLDFFNNRRVLITGHSGFKGSWLTLWLQKMGANVFGYSLDIPTQPSLFEELRLNNEIITYWADINRQEYLKFIINKNNIELVFHLAAQALVIEGIENPQYTFQTNAMGTASVLEAVRSCPSVEATIIITSDKCYQPNASGHYKETDPLGGNDPYSASKACAEIITNAYRETYKLNMATARAGNVIGGGDWQKHRLIPDIIQSITSNQDIVLRYPQAIRPWQFVLEPLFGYLQLGMELYSNSNHRQAYNFGPNADRQLFTVHDITSKIVEMWGDEYKNEIIIRGTQHAETGMLRIDSMKAKRTNSGSLGWKQILTTKEALQKTIDWYKLYYQGNIDMNEFSLKQIQEYENRLKNED